MNTKPIVSICCNTYNHAKYIKDAIDGFLMQKTFFPYEIIIHDDASTDGTRQIIKEYAERNPELIYPIFQTENQYSKKQKSISARFVWPHVRGKYIALCEGDDYWTDPHKLQKQVDFLEVHPEYSLSFHAVEDFNMDTGKTGVLRYKCKNGFRTFNVNNAILIGGALLATNSMVFRSEFIRSIPEWYDNAPAGDFALTLILSSRGRIAYFDDVMSVYRRGVPGSWTNRMKNRNNMRTLHKNTDKMLLSFNRYTLYKYFIPIMIKILKNRLDLFLYNLRIVFGK